MCLTAIYLIFYVQPSGERKSQTNKITVYEESEWTEEATGMLQTNGNNRNLTLPIAHIASSNPLPGIVANIGSCQNQGKVLVFLIFSVYTGGIFKQVTYN